MKIQSNAANILQVGNIHGQRAFQQFKPKPHKKISAKNNWGVETPEEKKWVRQHMAESPDERIHQLEKRVKALMFTRQRKIEAEQKIGQQRKHIQELGAKLNVAQTRIRQLELEVDRYKLERDMYYKKAVERLNRYGKESGLPTLSPSQLGSDPQVAAGGTELPGQPEERSSPERNLSREPVS